MQFYEPLYHALQICQLYPLALQIKSGRILDILWAFLMKQLFHSHLLDTRWL